VRSGGTAIGSADGGVGHDGSVVVDSDRNCPPSLAPVSDDEFGGVREAEVRVPLVDDQSVGEEADREHPSSASARFDHPGVSGTGATADMASVSLAGAAASSSAPADAAVLEDRVDDLGDSTGTDASSTIATTKRARSDVQLASAGESSDESTTLLTRALLESRAPRVTECRNDLSMNLSSLDESAFLRVALDVESQLYGSDHEARLAAASYVRPAVRKGKRRASGSALLTETVDPEEHLRSVAADQPYGSPFMVGMSDADLHESLAAAVHEMYSFIDSGGMCTVFFVGAGTSGRIGCLVARSLRARMMDMYIKSSMTASRIGHEDRLSFHYIIAGGDRALVESVEDAEDDLGVSIERSIALTCKERIRTSYRPKRQHMAVVVGISCGLSANCVLSVLRRKVDTSGETLRILVGFNPASQAKGHAKDESVGGAATGPASFRAQTSVPTVSAGASDCGSESALAGATSSGAPTAHGMTNSTVMESDNAVSSMPGSSTAANTSLSAPPRSPSADSSAANVRSKHHGSWSFKFLAQHLVRLEREEKKRMTESSEVGAQPHRNVFVLVPVVGPELLTGSTRLKGGTATKVLLDLLFNQLLDRMFGVTAWPVGPEATANFFRDNLNMAYLSFTRGNVVTAAMRSAASSIRNGGRIFYLAASRLGGVAVVDASECPPTFGADGWQVQGYSPHGWRECFDSVSGDLSHFASALGDQTRADRYSMRFADFERLYLDREADNRLTSADTVIVLRLGAYARSHFDGADAEDVLLEEMVLRVNRFVAYGSTEDGFVLYSSLAPRASADAAGATASGVQSRRDPDSPSHSVPTGPLVVHRQHDEHHSEPPPAFAFSLIFGAGSHDRSDGEYREIVDGGVRQLLNETRSHSRKRRKEAADDFFKELVRVQRKNLRSLKHRVSNTYREGRLDDLWQELVLLEKERHFQLLGCFGERSAPVLVHQQPDSSSTILAAAELAAKSFLNLVTTFAFCKAGKVMENVMVDMRVSNNKLLERASRIIAAAAKTTEASAEAILLRVIFSMVPESSEGADEPPVKTEGQPEVKEEGEVKEEDTPEAGANDAAPTQAAPSQQWMDSKMLADARLNLLGVAEVDQPPARRLRVTFRPYNPTVHASMCSEEIVQTATALQRAPFRVPLIPVAIVIAMTGCSVEVAYDATSAGGIEDAVEAARDAMSHSASVA